MADNEWWRSFFSGLWLDVQRRHMAERTGPETDFIAAALRLAPGARVLDVPCGDGRLALEMAARGFALTAMDLNAALLQVGRDAAAEGGLQLDWQQRDMRDTAEGEPFDGAFCMWGSFGYFDDAGNRAFLQSVSDSLRPGAGFVIDVPNVMEQVLPNLQQRSWWPSGDAKVLESMHFDHQTSRIDGTWTVVRGGEQSDHALSIRVYGYRELVALLESVGLVECEAYSTLDGEPYQVGERLYLVARRGR